jgi:phosphotransferase system enzyme I (PtsI)
MDKAGGIHIRGISVVPGLVKAKTIVYRRAEVAAHVPLQIVPDKAEAELELATRKVKSDIDRLYRHALELGQDETSEILDTQLFMLDDPELALAIRQKMLAGVPLDRAIRESINVFVELITAGANAHIKERIVDITDVGERLIRAIHRTDVDLDLNGNIVVCDELSPAEVVEFSQNGMAGLVMQRCGPNAHAAIIAKAFGIPCLVQAANACSLARHGETALLDAVNGHLLINADSGQIARFDSELTLFKSREKQLDALAGKPCFLTCGTQVQLEANIEFEEELSALRRYPVDGIGLLRTEMLYLFTDGFSDMDQQVRFYTKAGKAAKTAVTIRLLDVGGDKMHDGPVTEQNPYLGWRGVRILIDRPVLLQNQIEAILRAASRSTARFRILIPMVSDVLELLDVKKQVHEVAGRLAMQGVTPKKPVEVGVMIETPSSALLAEAMGRECDFFSIGTNDLTQYTLAVDRGNSKVSQLYDSLHPSVLRLISMASREQRNGVKVAVCGEAASNAFSAIVLVGLGIRELSMAPQATRDVHQTLSRISLIQAEELARKMEQAGSLQEVHRLKEAFLHQFGTVSF